MTKVTRSLLRGLHVLEALAALGTPTGPATLAAATALDKATVSRLLATFVEAGYLTHDPGTGRYWLTGRMLRITRAFLHNSDLLDLARPHLVALRDDTGESVHLGQLDGLQVVYIDKLESSNSVRLVSAVGQSMPLHTTALGKSVLSALPDDQRRALISKLVLTARTSDSITDPEALVTEVEQTAELGYATDQGENEENVTCVGAPIRDGGGQLIAAISVSGPSFRVAQDQEALGMRCRQAAVDISLDLPAEQFAPVVFPSSDASTT